MRLSVAEQKRLLSALPSHRKLSVKRQCQACQQSGEGIGDMFKKVKKILGPIASEIGPVALKHFILPMLLKKAGLSSGSGRSGCKTAGAGRVVRKTVQLRPMWRRRVKLL